MSQAAYLREVLMKAHEVDRGRRAMREGLARIDEMRKSIDLSYLRAGAGARAVHTVRREYEHADAEADA